MPAKRAKKTEKSPAPARPMTRRGLEARIVAKAWRDPKYNARLLKDPKSVLEEELKAIDPSITLPDSLQVFVHEEAADTYHLVLPRNPREVFLGELIGDNLEAVAPQTVAVVVSVTQVSNVNAVVVMVPVPVSYGIGGSELAVVVAMEAVSVVTNLANTVATTNAAAVANP